MNAFSKYQTLINQLRRLFVIIDNGKCIGNIEQNFSILFIVYPLLFDLFNLLVLYPAGCFEHSFV